MATFRWMKSWKKGDLYAPASAAGTASISLVIKARHKGLTLLIPVSFDVPVGVHILGVVLRHAGSLDLLETPLRQVDITGAEIASKGGMLESESSRQGPDLGSVARGNVADDFHRPVILLVADGGVSVARDFLVRLGDWGGDVVGVQVTASLGVDQANDIAISDVLQGCLWIELGLVAVRVEPPLVVGVFVVVAGDLLLRRAFGIGLNVGVEQTTTVSHVLES